MYTGGFWYNNRNRKWGITFNQGRIIFLVFFVVVVLLIVVYGLTYSKGLLSSSNNIPNYP